MSRAAHACLVIALVTAAPVWSQEGTAGVSSANTGVMQVPAPVSGGAYPMALGGEARSNYLHAGLGFNTAYDDNIIPGTGSSPISDVSYTVSPLISLDQTTSRLHQTLIYRPGFTLYQHNSDLNQFDQQLAFDLQYRLSPHVTASLADTLQKSSTAFNQLTPLSGGAISGSLQSPVLPVVAPFANQLSNSANVALSYQFSSNSMIGASELSAILRYLNPSQAPGLADSTTGAAEAFYSHRLSEAQYFGVAYQYSAIDSTFPDTQSTVQNGTDSNTITQTVLFFYSLNLTSNLSISLSSGPEYFNVSQSPFHSTHSWTPAAMASMGWQNPRTSIAASYSHIVSGGGGLQGAFNSNSAGLSFRRQLTRTWTIDAMARYSITANVSEVLSHSSPGGKSLYGTLSVQHPLSDRLKIECGYMRISQTYANIAAVSNTPNANREFMTISYQLTMPVGR